MKIDTLAPSLFVDVLSHAGETYCALLELGTGLVVMRWPDGHAENPVIMWVDPHVKTHGFPRLTAFSGDVFVAYRRDDPAPEHVVAVGLTTGVIAPWTVPCWGMHPLCWGFGGKLAVTADLGHLKRVHVAMWPDKPSEGPMSRDANQAPTGISRMDAANVIFWHEEQNEPLFQQRVWSQDITGLVGVTHDDRVVVDILSTRGVVLSGHPYRAPRITRQADGAYTIASHREGSQGPTGVEIVTGITKADLTVPVEEPLPPVESVPLLGREFGLVCYTFDDADTVGNISLPIRPSHLHFTPESVFIPTIEDEDHVPDLDLFAIYCGETKDLSAEQAIAIVRPVGAKRFRGLAVYQDSYPMRDSVMALAEPRDLLTPQVYRNAGEEVNHYAMRLRMQFADASLSGECWPTVNIHRRYKDNPDGTSSPTLSVREVIEGFVAACQIAKEQGWPGMVLFRIGTSDVPPEIEPYIARFLSGITAVPQPRVIEEPEEPDEPEEPVMPYVVLTKDTKLDPVIVLTKVTEISHNGKTFLEKPDKRVITITPGGGLEDRDPGTFGPWEEVIKTPKGYVAEREGGKVYGLVTV